MSDANNTHYAGNWIKFINDAVVANSHPQETPAPLQYFGVGWAGIKTKFVDAPSDSVFE